MNTKTMILLGGAAVVGGVILLQSRRANASPLLGPSEVPTTIQKSQADIEAELLGTSRAVAGARAIANNGSAGGQSLINGILSGASAKAAGGLGAMSDRLIPGTGGFVQTVSGGIGSYASGATAKIITSTGSAITSGLKKLKFW